MADPFIVLGDDGEDAPRLRYNIPESTSYSGRSVIGVDVNPQDLNQQTRDRLRENRRAKFERPDVVRPSGSIGSLRLNFDRGSTPSSSQPLRAFFVSGSEEREDLRADAPLTATIKRPLQNMAGYQAAFELVIPTSEPEEVISPQILFFETLKVSSFLGNYGAGRVLKTFSLFPGEQTTISIKNYKKTTEKSSQKINEGSSILDSVTEEASSDFEDSILSEQGSKWSESESDILNSESRSTHKEGSGGASVLFGLVKASGSGASTEASQTTGEWGTRSAREETAKNVTNALEKHSSRASAKRNVEINTSSETATSVEEETSEEIAIERKIENINKSRTLNLVFRQMIQEFISVVHLTDLRIALYDETDGPYATYSLRELDRFLEDHFVEDQWSAIRRNILREFYYVFDYQDRPQAFLEVARLDFPDDDVDLDVDFPDDVTYLRVRKDMRSQIEGSEFVEVDGVALAVSRFSMRTEGVVADSVLGEGDALDDYAQAVQAQTTQELIHANRMAEIKNGRMELENRILDERDDVAATVHGKLFPCCPTHMYAPCGCVKIVSPASPEDDPRTPPVPGDA